MYAHVHIHSSYSITGSYDGYLHVMDAVTGAIYWALNVSNEPIKSSPSVDSVTSLVWFGSHDHHLYSLDVEVCVLYSYLASALLCNKASVTLYFSFIG